MRPHILLALLLLTGSALADLEVSGHASGQGYQEHSLEAAGQLIQFTNDTYPSVEDWSYLLAMHDFDVPAPGLLVINGTEFDVFENGSIFERLV